MKNRSFEAKCRMSKKDFLLTLNDSNAVYEKILSNFLCSYFSKPFRFAFIKYDGIFASGRNICTFCFGTHHLHIQVINRYFYIYL